ncbi:hypothetical protein EST38_g11851 [Candolleomyces aberdarensis]|uniref:DUF4360 domain-containing protein n=1 Tax=Candolleomyces aberdarensis TaxID=2316362 RepID=A0A4Q2D768_9AGAR|nr:hypothetical protein EST38_g11851 [Candolleomyces aberdarensis]
MLKALLPLALAISAIPAFANPIAARAVPAGFSITSISPSGTGCPPSSVFYVLNAGGTAFSIIFSEFSAEAGPGASAGSDTKTCTLNLGVNIPAGYRFTLEAVDSRAFYHLDSQVKASREFAYSFSGSTGTGTTSSEVSGPLQGDFAHTDAFDDAGPSPCGGSTTLNLVSKISVDNTANTSGMGFVAIDAMDSNAALDTRFRWEAC